MKASDVRLSSLKTYEDHKKAISLIEINWRNTVGGYKAWVSGYQTFLTKAAEKKIEAIEKRMDRLFPCSEGGWEEE